MWESGTPYPSCMHDCPLSLPHWVGVPQVGGRFWDLALREHAANNRGGRFDDSMSSFFRNVDTRCRRP
jgi:hypothetical protein